VKKAAPHIAGDVLLGYLEGVLDKNLQDEVQKCTHKNRFLREALDGLRSQERELVELGNVLRVSTPGIHIGDSVLRAIKKPDILSGSLEQELAELGSRIREGIPRVEVISPVRAALEKENDLIPSSPLEADLMSLGEILRTRVPEMDFIPHVTGALDRSDLSGNGFVTASGQTKSARSRRSSLTWPLIGLAAGLLLCLGFLVFSLMPVDTGGAKVAQRETARKPVTRDHRREVLSAPTVEEKTISPEKSPSGKESLLSLLARPTPSGEALPSRDGKSAPRTTFTMEEVLAAKRKSLESGAGAAAMLAKWGTLDPNDVRRLIETESLTPAQLAGMSRFLTAGEAVALLKEAVERNPEDAGVRFVLAMQLMDDPAASEEAFEHLAVLKEQEPANALVYYMDAKLRFSVGDYANGLSLLGSAAELRAGNAHGVANAQYHDAALEAGGIPADLAGTVAAFYAGTDEYAAVSQLKSDLLAHGAVLEAEGNYEDALAVYKSVGEMGRQVSRGAAYTNEYLAGLDTQMDAVEAMNALAELVEIPGGLQTIQEAYDIFVQGLDLFLEYTSLLADVTCVEDREAIQNVVSGILQTGDIAYLQNMDM